MEDGENPISSIEGDGEPGRVRISSTRRGLILAGLGVSLFVVGMWRVDGVMASMGVAVAALFAIAWLIGWLNLRGLSMHYRGPRRVEAGKGFPGKLSLANDGRAMDGFSIEFRVNLMGERELSGRSPWLGCGGTAEIADRVVLAKRGFAGSHRGRIRSGFPLGLMSFAREVPVVAEIGVLPKPIIPRELYLGGYLLDGSPFGASRHFGGIGEWKGLRERRSGDGLRRIAWAASLRSEAAGGAMLVREDEPPGTQAEACMVVFHSYGGDGNLIRPDRFEKALSLLFGALGALSGRGMPVRFTADFNGWRGIEIRTGRQLAVARESIMFAERSPGTEAHDLMAALAIVGEHECVVVVSDMPRAAWDAFVPAFPIPPVLVDVSTYDVSRRIGAVPVKGGRP